MYLYSGKCRECKCGQETGLKDVKGNMLYTGDIVVLCTVDGGYFSGFTAVVSGQYTTYQNGHSTFEHKENEEYEYFIMGIKSADLAENEWYFEKVKSYQDAVDGEKWNAFGFNYKSN